ncbi:MAG: zinc-ribbon domain-containing protein [Desulfobacteraceae bacterium]|jgi:hypothetical protein
MEVICSGCNAKLNIPDDKIPRDQAARINCPKCKTRITIDPQDNGDDVSAKGNNISDEDSGDDYSLNYYEETKLALVMTDENIHDKIKPAIEGHNYKFITVPTIREALLKLRFHQFDLMVLADGFDGQEIVGGPIMNYLNHLSMSIRRGIFLTIIGEKYQTMDEMMAFAMSANMVVNTKDLVNFAPILKRGIGDNEKFYRVFLDTFEKEGKI